MLKKNTIDYNEFINIYINSYKDPKIKNYKAKIEKKYIIFILIIISLLTLSLLVYNFKH